MTEPTTEPTPTDEMVERVARALYDAYEDHSPVWTWERCEAEDEMDGTLDAYRHMARHALAALAPELNRADLTVRAFALTVGNAKKAGKRTIPVEELDKVVADPMRVVMK